MEDIEPFVERRFVADGSELLCRFFRPVSDGQDFRCRYEITWPDGTKSREIWGVDSVQAVVLAMRSAGGDLMRRRDQDGVDVRWLDGPNFGLPPHEEQDWTASERGGQ